MGHFILGHLHLKTFSKKPTTVEEQIELLQERGMMIPSMERASAFLSYCSYYRFAAMRCIMKN